jgi:hypothetical protein
VQKILLAVIATAYFVGLSSGPASAAGFNVQTIKIIHSHEAGRGDQDDELNHAHHHHDEHDSKQAANDSQNHQNESHQHTHEIQIVSMCAGITTSQSMVTYDLEHQVQSRNFVLVTAPKRPYLNSIFRPPIA